LSNLTVRSNLHVLIKASNFLCFTRGYLHSVKTELISGASVRYLSSFSQILTVKQTNCVLINLTLHEECACLPREIHRCCTNSPGC